MRRSVPQEGKDGQGGQVMKGWVYQVSIPEWRVMERVFQKSRNFKEAEDWDILQHVRMTSAQRQEAARQLRDRVYGKDAPDVREAQKRK